MQRARNAALAAQRLRASASTRAFDLMNSALTGAKSGSVDLGLNVGHKIVTPVVRYHVTAALGGTDPELPNSVRGGIDLLAEDVCVDVEVKILEALRENIGGVSSDVKHIPQDGPKCCRPNCCSYLRSRVLYTLYPYDRSIWSQLRDPWFYILKILTVFPMFYVSISTWFLLWLLKDKCDEYSLVRFIVDLKTSLFFSAILNSMLGNFWYLRCTTISPADYPCYSYSPGQLQPFWPVAGFFLLQLALTFISAIFNCCSVVKGEKAKKTSKQLGTSALVKDLERQTYRRRSRIFCWLVYDLVAVAIIIGIVILAIVAAPEYGSLKSTLNSSSTTAVAPPPPVSNNNPLFTPEQHIPRDLAEVLYWCRVLYGFLCAPWIILLFPGMFPLLTHTKQTGYSRGGRTVPIASSQIRLQNYLYRQEKRQRGASSSSSSSSSSSTSTATALSAGNGQMEMSGSNPMGTKAGGKNSGGEKTTGGHRTTQSNSNNPFKR